jgi:uncharacterized protein (DUF2252 family)
MVKLIDTERQRSTGAHLNDTTNYLQRIIQHTILSNQIFHCCSYFTEFQRQIEETIANTQHLDEYTKNLDDQAKQLHNKFKQIREICEG